jgi:hypothetical protein
LQADHASIKTERAAMAQTQAARAAEVAKAGEKKA